MELELKRISRAYNDLRIKMWEQNKKAEQTEAIKDAEIKELRAQLETLQAMQREESNEYEIHRSASVLSSTQEAIIRPSKTSNPPSRCHLMPLSIPATPPPFENPPPEDIAPLPYRVCPSPTLTPSPPRHRTPEPQSEPSRDADLLSTKRIQCYIKADTLPTENIPYSGNISSDIQKQIINPSLSNDQDIPETQGNADVPHADDDREAQGFSEDMTVFQLRAAKMNAAKEAKARQKAERDAKRAAKRAATLKKKTGDVESQCSSENGTSTENETSTRQSSVNPEVHIF